MTDRYYIAEVKCDFMVVQVTLNGWPIARHAGDGPSFIGKKLNPWLVEGDNTIEVSLASPVAGEPDPRATFYIQVYVVDDGKEMTDDDVLFVYRWSAIESPLPLRGEPTPKVVFSHTMRVGSAFGRFGWEDATPFQPADRADVLQLVDEVHAAFSRKDVTALMALLRIKNEEIARAIGSTTAKMEQQTTMLWNDHYFGGSDNDFELAPHAHDDIRLVPWSSGRLVEVQHASWPHPIIGRSDYRFAFDLTVSKIANTWRVVR